MPDPLLYSAAMALAATVSKLTVLLAALIAAPLFARRESATATWLNVVCVAALAMGMAACIGAIELQIAWPPRSALDRLLTLVLPAVLLVEVIAGLPQLPRYAAWMLRAPIAAATPPVLLYGSVYVNGAGDYTATYAAILIVAGAALLLTVWSLLDWLSRRSPGVSLPLAICLAAQTSGVVIMLAGYIKGGAAAIPLVGALVAVAVTALLVSRLTAPVLVAAGSVGLFGLLFIGRFFGEVSTPCALVLLLAPLLCWATELPQLRPCAPWMIAFMRLSLVAVPLLVVLLLAKQAFDRDMAPLLGELAPGTHYSVRR